MFDISFEIKGEEVKPENSKDVLDMLFMRHVREKIEKCLGNVRCQEHGRQPAIKVKGPNLDSLAYEVSGCCSKFIESTRKKLR